MAEQRQPTANKGAKRPAAEQPDPTACQAKSGTVDQQNPNRKSPTPA